MSRATRNVVAMRDVPADIRSLSTISEPDYADMFRLMTSATETTAEAWARAMYEDTLGARGQFIFSVILGLNLAPAQTPETVAGWRIAEHGHDWIRLEAEGGRLVGQIVVRAAEGELSVATFMLYVNRLGAVTWTAWSAVHRKAMPKLLRDAAGIVEG